jgi:hypothetical protein
MMFAVDVPIRLEVSGTADIGGVIDGVTDQLALIGEEPPELLDFAVSSDAGTDGSSFELTVDAEDPVEALGRAVGWVNAAIRAASGKIPGWMVRDVEDVSVQALTVPLS